MVVAHTATRDYDWISRNIQEDEEVSIVDVSPQYSTLSLMGPKSRELLSRVIADRDLSNEVRASHPTQHYTFAFWRFLLLLRSHRTRRAHGP
jgi:glycine cleavage system aminomethyltransferase T